MASEISSSSATPLSATAPSPTSLTHSHHFISLKLTSTNFLNWKTQLLPYLRGQQLYRYIDGTFSCPPSTQSLASPSQTRLLQLRLSLQQLKQNDHFATAFLNDAKTIADELAAAGTSLSPSEFNLYVFQGLQPDFKDLVTTFTARPEPVSFWEIHSLLLSHEFLHRTTPTPAPTSIPQAHFVQPTSRGRSRGGFSRGHGRSRGRNGHNRPSHNFGSRFSSGSGLLPIPSADNRVHYQISNRTNHIAPQCYSRFDHLVAPSAHFTSYGSEPPSSTYGGLSSSPSS
ncbi:hypothetical protein CsSME_00040436 [Camellia sinensis var. sinensis]